MFLRNRVFLVGSVVNTDMRLEIESHDGVFAPAEKRARRVKAYRIIAKVPRYARLFFKIQRLLGASSDADIQEHYRRTADTIENGYRQYEAEKAKSDAGD